MTTMRERAKHVAATQRAPLAIYKFLIREGEPRFFPSPEDPAQLWLWEGVVAAVLASSVEEARAVVLREHPEAHAWVQHVEPIVMELDGPKHIVSSTAGNT